MKFLIDKQFSFCYGHRVYVQKLNEDFCAKGDTETKCRHLHGHEGLLHVFLESDELNEQAMVTDFKHLGWLKNFIDDCLDHKFIMDFNDPMFKRLASDLYFDATNNSAFKDSDAWKQVVLEFFVPVNVPGTSKVAGYVFNKDYMKNAPANIPAATIEILEGYFLVDFVPTSENLCRWMFENVQAKMDLINVKTARIDWFETPKSRSSYRAD